MSEYKTEIGNIDAGSRFYFPNDPEKKVWTVIDSKRKSDHGPGVYIYCEDANGKLLDYNSNRSVVCLRGDSMPAIDQNEQSDSHRVDDEPAVMILPKTKTDYRQIVKNISSIIVHKEASIKVYCSHDYSCFKMINGNRSINDHKVKKIIKEIDNGNDMLQYYPIQVKEVRDRLTILDGQHRFYISKILKRPVYYILVAEEKSMPDIAKINSNVEKWKASDFINCYVQHGNENYKILQKFLEEYQISLTVSLQMLNLGNPGTDAGTHGKLNDDFRNGIFEIKHLPEAEALAEECRSFAPFAYCNNRSFVIAIYRIKKAGLISIPELREVYNKRQEMLTQQATFKAYINTLEQIVNVGKKIRIVIV